MVEKKVEQTKKKTATPTVPTGLTKTRSSTGHEVIHGNKTIKTSVRPVKGSPADPSLKQLKARPGQAPPGQKYVVNCFTAMKKDKDSAVASRRHQGQVLTCGGVKFIRGIWLMPDAMLKHAETREPQMFEYNLKSGRVRIYDELSELVEDMRDEGGVDAVVKLIGISLDYTFTNTMTWEFVKQAIEHFHRVFAGHESIRDFLAWKADQLRRGALGEAYSPFDPDPSLGNKQLDWKLET